MQLIKHAHACVSLVKDGGRIAVDPGTFTPDAKEVVAAADAVLITHEHFDHFDEELIAQALEARPSLRVYGPAGVVERWAARRGQVTAVADGDRLDVAGFDIAVSGDLHATIHRDIPASPTPATSSTAVSTTPATRTTYRPRPSARCCCPPADHGPSSARQPTTYARSPPTVSSRSTRSCSVGPARSRRPVS